jgi:hypothetical protein
LRSRFTPYSRNEARWQPAIVDLVIASIRLDQHIKERRFATAELINGAYKAPLLGFEKSRKSR